MRPKDEAKQAAIVHACLDLVQAEGIAGVKMSKVARLAGLATGTVYIYHAGKKELLAAVYTAQREQFAECLLKGEMEKRPFRVMFRQLVERYFLYQVEEARSLHFMEQYEQSGLGNEGKKEEPMPRKDPLLELLERGHEEMLVREEEANLLHAVVQGILTAVARQYASEGKVPDAATAKLVGQIAWDAVKG